MKKTKNIIFIILLIVIIFLTSSYVIRNRHSAYEEKNNNLTSDNSKANNEYNKAIELGEEEAIRLMESIKKQGNCSEKDKRFIKDSIMYMMNNYDDVHSKDDTIEMIKRSSCFAKIMQEMRGSTKDAEEMSRSLIYKFLISIDVYMLSYINGDKDLGFYKKDVDDLKKQIKDNIDKEIDLYILKLSKLI